MVCAALLVSKERAIKTAKDAQQNVTENMRHGRTTGSCPLYHIPECCEWTTIETDLSSHSIKSEAGHSVENSQRSS